MNCPPLLGAEVDASHLYLSVGAVVGVMAATIPVAWKLVQARDAFRDVCRECEGLRHKVRSLEAKVDTVWSAQLTRGKVEGERSGHMVFASGSRSISSDSFELSVDAWNRFGPIRRGLRAIGREIPEADESSLTLMIERRYGRWIIENICRPLGIHDMSCLVMAAQVARSVEGDSEQAFSPAPDGAD